MSDRDPVRDAFGDARGRLQGAFVPAGVDAVLGTVRRRRVRRRAGAVTVIAAVAALAVAVPWANRATPPAVPGPSPSASPSELPQPSATPTAEEIDGAGAGPKPTCRAKPEAYVEGAGAAGDHEVTMGLTDASTFCAGRKVKIFWASYACQADGTQDLVEHETFHLEPGDRSVTTTVRWPADPENLGVRVIYVVGDLGVLSEIPVGKRQQYPYWTRARGSGAFANHTMGDMHCGPPPSATPSASPSA